MSDDNIQSNQKKEDLERVQRAVEQLGEHFETVQIFVSRHMPGELDGTISTNRGLGNWFARYGQVSEWVVYENERIRVAARPAPDAN